MDAAERESANYVELFDPRTPAHRGVGGQLLVKHRRSRADRNTRGALGGKGDTVSARSPVGREVVTYRGGVEIAELLELEHQGWSSLCDGTGADFYGRLMTPDAVMVLAHGLAMDREAVIASLNDAPPWQAYDISDERLVEVDADTAALIYTGRASRGSEDHFHALMSTVYTRCDGQWRLALYQQTPIPPIG